MASDGETACQLGNQEPRSEGVMAGPVRGEWRTDTAKRAPEDGWSFGGGRSPNGSPAWGVATSCDSEPEARDLEERFTRLEAKIEQRMDAVQVMLQTIFRRGKAPGAESQAKKESGDAGSSEGTNSRSCTEPRPEVAQMAPVPSVRKRGPTTTASSRGAKRALSSGTEPEGLTGRATPGSSGAGSRSQEPEERLDWREGDLQQQTTAVPGMQQAWRGGPRAPAGAAAEGGVETRLAEVVSLTGSAKEGRRPAEAPRFRSSRSELSGSPEPLTYPLTYPRTQDRLHSEVQGGAPSRDDLEALVKWSWLAETAGDAGDRGKQEAREAAPEARRRSRRRKIEVGDARQTAGTCYRCGGKGHRMVQCPSRQGVLASCTKDGGRRFPATRNPDRSWEETAAHGAVCSGAGWLTRKPGSARRGERASGRRRPATLRRTPEQPTEWQHEEERDSRNYSPMRIRVHLKGVRSEAEAKVDALLDSGCTHCLIHPVLASALGLRVRRLREPLALSQLDGSTAGGDQAQYRTEPVGLTVGTSREELGLVVAPVADHALVLGLAWLTRQNPHIDWVAKTVRFGGTTEQTRSSRGGGAGAEDPTELGEVATARRRAEGRQGPGQPTAREANTRTAPRASDKREGSEAAKVVVASTTKGPAATQGSATAGSVAAGPEGPVAKQAAITRASRAGAGAAPGADRSAPSVSEAAGGRPGPGRGQGNLEGCRTLREPPLESTDPKTSTQLEAKGGAQPPREKQGKGAEPELRRRCAEASEEDPWLANNKDSLEKRGTCWEHKGRLYVPEACRVDVLRRGHTEDTTGHCGFVRTFHLLREQFWWPSLRRDTREYVASCSTCAAAKEGKENLRGPAL